MMIEMITEIGHEIIEMITETGHEISLSYSCPVSVIISIIKNYQKLSHINHVLFQ